MPAFYQVTEGRRYGLRFHDCGDTLYVAVVKHRREALLSHIPTAGMWDARHPAGPSFDLMPDSAYRSSVDYQEDFPAMIVHDEVI